MKRNMTNESKTLGFFLPFDPQQGATFFPIQKASLTLTTSPGRLPKLAKQKTAVDVKATYNPSNKRIKGLVRAYQLSQSPRLLLHA